MWIAEGEGHPALTFDDDHETDAKAAAEAMGYPRVVWHIDDTHIDRSTT